MAGFGRETRGDTLDRAAESIRATKFKVQAYAEYLAGEKAQLDPALADAERELRDKVAELIPEVEPMPVA